MAKNKKPTKRYTRKPVSIPITSGLKDALAEDTYFSLMAMESGAVDVVTWKRMAKVLMTVSFATDEVSTVDKSDKVAIDSAVLTIKSISDREVRTGQWHVTPVDIQSLSRGVTAADKAISALDYRKLKQGYLSFISLMRSIK